ncbi:MAG: succinylglutamate desuccinylase/aspartoacylase family protein [Alphaproteobacteria bacterium]|nr:succinylglutamate desuccinylase/aspartoacylase family protein [Alphaproteobacteria bacterium]
MDAVARRRLDAIQGAAGRDAGLPVVVWSAGPGPTVAITANVHGDEVVGVAAAHALDDAMSSTLRRGTLLIYPSLNPRGLQQMVRVHPEEGTDLNRLFPGDRQGGGTARCAALIWSDLLARRPDLLIDLHSDSSVSIPYAIVDRATSLRPDARTEMEARLEELARATGLLVLHEYPPEEYVRFRLDRSLAGAMVNHARVPALTLEVGARRTVDPASVRTATHAVLRVLHHADMLVAPPAEPDLAPPSGAWRRAAAPRSQTAGLFTPALPPGARFAAGQVLGTVRAVDGSVREVVRSESRGIVVSWSESPWLEARGVPGTLGLEEQT